MNEPIAPDTPISVSIGAQDWNTVINLLRDVSAPHRLTDPLIQQLVRQVQAGAQAAATQAAQAAAETAQPIPRPNGVDHAEPRVDA